MADWLVWLLLGVVFWCAIAVVVAFAYVRVLAWSPPVPAEGGSPRRRGLLPRARPLNGHRGSPRPRILVVESDRSLRSLIMATLIGEAAELVEAETADDARSVAATLRPDLVLLDVLLPDANGLVFCAELQEVDDAPKVVLMAGASVSEKTARSAGAETVLRKPFTPFALLEVVHRLSAPSAAPRAALPAPAHVVDDAEQLVVYARELARVIEHERAQRQLLEKAYRQTLSTLVWALEARETDTNIHSLRVTRYALELARHASEDLLDDPTLMFGFLLHDIGKIAIPDSILLKEGPLDPVERREMQRHPEIGESILSGVTLLEGPGLEVVRSHHERWDGAGYPDGLAGDAIPRGARVFAVADALDALTSDRPYRPARDWGAAIEEIRRESGKQFDPEVVEVLLRQQPGLRTIKAEIVRAA